MTSTINPMLTLVLIPCVSCGSTAAEVQTDRRILGDEDGLCCIGPSSPPEVVCWFCSSPAPDPYRSCGRVYCSSTCAADYAE
jgi:hypothetical protein